MTYTSHKRMKKYSSNDLPRQNWKHKHRSSLRSFREAKSCMWTRLAIKLQVTSLILFQKNTSFACYKRNSLVASKPLQASSKIWDRSFAKKNQRAYQDEGLQFGFVCDFPNSSTHCMCFHGLQAAGKHSLSDFTQSYFEHNRRNVCRKCASTTSSHPRAKQQRINDHRFDRQMASKLYFFSSNCNLGHHDLQHQYCKIGSSILWLRIEEAMGHSAEKGDTAWNCSRAPCDQAHLRWIQAATTRLHLRVAACMMYSMIDNCKKTKTVESEFQNE